MVYVEYLYEIPYSIEGQTGRTVPKLQVQVINPLDETQALDTDAVIDTGTAKSLFSTHCAVAIGLDIANGTPYGWTTSAGGSISGRIHPVRLSIPNIGDFEMEIGFREEGGLRHDLMRNLLGRDFLDLIQIGFREHHQTLFITPTP